MKKQRKSLSCSLNKSIKYLLLTVAMFLTSCASGVDGSSDGDNEADPVELCVDADGDGHYIYIAVTCSNGTDYCDDNPVSYSRLGCESCVDNDGDGYGIDCDFGSDCNDENPELFDFCPALRVEPKMRWPDTGQSKCYSSTEEIPCPAAGEDFYGQDGNYSINPMSFTDNGDGTVTDNVTGLMWQQGEEIYNSESTNFEDLITYCDEFSLGGFTDWRVPVFYELLSIIDYSEYSPPINTGYFEPNTTSVNYHPGNGHYIGLILPVDEQDIFYAIDTVFGGGWYLSKDSAFGPWHLRCVRLNSPYQDESFNFIDNGDGTITDMITSLVWQKVSNGEMLLWNEALEYCSDLNLGGYTDWRLPNIKELGTVYDVTHPSGGWDRTIFVVNEVSGWGYGSNWFWTSTSWSYHSEDAFSFDFYGGYIFNDNKTSGNYYSDEYLVIEGFQARCVR